MSPTKKVRNNQPLTGRDFPSRPDGRQLFAQVIADAPALFRKETNPPANPIRSIAHVALLARGIVSVWVAPSLGEYSQTILNHFFFRSDLCDERCSNLLVKGP